MYNGNLLSINSTWAIPLKETAYAIYTYDKGNPPIQPVTTGYVTGPTYPLGSIAAVPSPTGYFQIDGPGGAYTELSQLFPERFSSQLPASQAYKDYTNNVSNSYERSAVVKTFFDLANIYTNKIATIGTCPGACDVAGAMQQAISPNYGAEVLSVLYNQGYFGQNATIMFNTNRTQGINSLSPMTVFQPNITQADATGFGYGWYNGLYTYILDNNIKAIPPAYLKIFNPNIIDPNTNQPNSIFFGFYDSLITRSDLNNFLDILLPMFGDADTATTRLCANLAFTTLNAGDPISFRYQYGIVNDAIVTHIPLSNPTVAVKVQYNCNGINGGNLNSTLQGVQLSCNFTPGNTSFTDTACQTQLPYQLLDARAVSASATYSWNPSNLVNNPTIKNPLAQIPDYTKFLCTVTDPTSGFKYVDTFNIYLRIIPPPSATSNSPLCGNGTETLQMQLTRLYGPDTTITWFGPNGFTSNLSNISIPNITKEFNGIYKIIATYKGCNSDTFYLDVKIGLDGLSQPTSNSPVCLGSTLIVKANQAQPTYSYSWTGPNGFTANTPEATVSTNTQFINAGDYSLTVRVPNNPTCIGINTTTVVVESTPANVYAGPDRTILKGTSTQLMVTTSSKLPAKYSWVPTMWLNNANIQNPIASPLETTRYIATLTTACGSDTSGVNIAVINSINIPNAFSPNSGLNANNVWRVPQLGQIGDLNVEIFDRNGSIVFQSTDRNFYWNGRLRNTGSMLPFGVYYYVIKSIPLKQTFSGWITLVN